MSQPLTAHDGFDLETEFKHAEKLWRGDEYASALQAFLGILRSRLKVAEKGLPLVDKFDFADLLVIERLVDASVLLNHLDAADSFLSALVNLTREANNLHAAEYYLLKRAHLSLERGQLRPVMSFLSEMHPTIGDIEKIEFTTDGLTKWESSIRWNGRPRDDCKVILSRLYLIMGRIHAANGQYGTALTVLQRGLLYTDPSAPNLAQAARNHLMVALVAAHLEKGELTEARNKLSRLKNIDSSLEPGIFVSLLQLSAKLDVLLGDFGQVTLKLRQIRDICAKMGLINGQLTAELNLAGHLIYLNQISLALRSLERVRKVAANLGDQEVIEEIARLMELADLQVKSPASGISIAPSVTEIKKIRRNTDQPKPTILKQEKLPDREPGQSWLALLEDYTLAFQHDLSLDPNRKDFSAAAARLNNIKQIFAYTDSELIRTRVSFLEALLDYYHGRILEAEEKLCAIRSTLKHLKLIPELWQLQRVMGWCWVRLEVEAADRSVLADETQQLLDHITSTLPPEERAIFLLNKWTADEEFIANQVDRLVDMKTNLFKGSRLLRVLQRWNMMRELNKLVNHIDSYKATLVKRSIDGDGEIVSGGFVSLWQRLFKHPLRRATICYVVLTDRLLIIQSKWMSLDFGVSVVTRTKLRQMVCSWHHDIEMRGERVRQTRKMGGKSEDESLMMAKELGALAEKLTPTLQIQNLVGTLPGRIKGLSIIPDDILNGMPFAAIRYKDKRNVDKYLVERYSISIGFDTSHPRVTRQETRNLRALLVGVSDGAQTGDGRFVSPLEGVDLEIEEVAKLMSQFLDNDRIVTLKNGAADRSTVLSTLADSQIAHVACHGEFKIDCPDQSGMILIPEQDKIQILSLRDLHETAFAHLKHITLASCWSADNFSIPGRWVISLPETLWRSGAQSILGSLWAVDDDLSVEFMKRFYQRLGKLPRDQALQRTQLDCISGKLPNGTRQTANPLLWSCFTLYGYPGHLKFKD